MYQLTLMDAGPRRMQRVREIIAADRAAEAVREGKQQAEEATRIRGMLEALLPWPRRERCGIVACTTRPSFAYEESSDRIFYYCDPHAQEAFEWFEGAFPYPVEEVA